MYLVSSMLLWCTILCMKALSVVLDSVWMADMLLLAAIDLRRFLMSRLVSRCRFSKTILSTRMATFTFEAFVSAQMANFLQPVLKIS